MADFIVTGVDTILTALDLLPERVIRKALSKAVNAAMKPIFREVVDRAPEGATHDLQSSVRIVVLPTRNRGEYALEIHIGEADFRGVTFYAAFVEYGTHRMRKRDFMKIAFEIRRDEATRIAVDMLVAAVERGFSDAL
jgi:HK97 gp10 family phage protein